MPDFSRWGGNGGDPSLNAIARTESYLDALASEQPVYATDPADAELSNLMAAWRDEVRRPTARVAAQRDAEIVLQRALASRRRTRMSMAVTGSVAAALLCLGGFGAVVYGAAPGDALYGLRVTLFGEQQVTRDDKVALAAQTEMQQVQQLIDQGNWDAAQDKLSTITSTVQTVEDPQRQQELQQQLNNLTVKVESRDPEATAPQSAPLSPEAPAGPGISLPVQVPALPNLPVPPSLPGQLPVPLPDISLPQLPIPQLPLPGPGVPPDISLPPIQLPKPLPDGPKPLPDGPKPLPDGPKPLPDGPKPLPKPGSDDDSPPKPGQDQPKPPPAPDEPEPAPKPVEPPKQLAPPPAPAPAPAPVEEPPPAAVIPVIPPAPKAPPALAPQQEAPQPLEPPTTVFPIPAEKPKSRN
jgi:hypothetical protein